MIWIYDQESFTKKFMSNLIIYSFSFRKKFKWKSSKHGILTVAIIRCDKRFFICSITSVNKWDVIGLKFAKFIPRSDYLFFAYNWQSMISNWFLKQTSKELCTCTTYKIHRKLLSAPIKRCTLWTIEFYLCDFPN